LRFAAIGRKGAMVEAMPAEGLRVSGNRLSMRHPGGVEQWWLSGPMGLEQGFELSERPEAVGGESSTPLVLRIEVTGATVESDGMGGARLLREDGSALRYTDLFAEDAGGNLLAAEMRQADKSIDPLVCAQTKKLLASDGAADDGFGTSVAISGNYAIAGACGADGSKGFESGSAYVFDGLLTDGSPCMSDSECSSGSCVDDVCCDSACGGGDTSDCQACSVAQRSSQDGVCEPPAANIECRTAAVACDVAEVSDGMSDACPSDEQAADGTSCGEEGSVCKAGMCTPPEGSGGSGATSGPGGSPGSNAGGDSGCSCSLPGTVPPGRRRTGLLWLVAVMLLSRRRSGIQTCTVTCSKLRKRF
jgi:hypothetical protein